MSLSVDTVLTVISLVRTAIDIYDKLQKVPDQMKELGRRMQKLNVYLLDLESFVKGKTKDAFSRLFDGQKRHLASLLDEIRQVTVKVTDLFHRWENDIGPLGFQFRFKTLTQAYFALNSSQAEIAKLIEDIKEQREDISHYLHLLGVRAVFAIGAGQASSQPVTNNPSQQQGQGTLSPGPGQGTNTGGNAKKVKKAKRPAKKAKAAPKAKKAAPKAPAAEPAAMPSAEQEAMNRSVIE